MQSQVIQCSDAPFTSELNVVSNDVFVFMKYF